VAAVLLAWEMGTGLSHADALLRVGRQLAAHGHQSTVVAHNLTEPGPLYRAASFPVLQAPVWHPRRKPQENEFRAATFADILAFQGWDDADDLHAMVQAWQHLLDLVRPDLIVCDHSPTLCLAAYGVLPVVILGVGFTVAPAEEASFPVLDPEARPLVPQGQLLEVVRQVQGRRGRPAPDTLPSLFAGAGRFVCSFPELDPYRAVRKEPAVGPLGVLPPLTPPPRPPRFFAYLAGDFVGLDVLLGAVGEAGLPGTAYVRGATPALREALARTGLDVRGEPLPFREALPQASVVLHHGGTTTAAAALAAGRPQLLLPRQLDNRLISQALHALGVATYLAGRQPREALGQALAPLVNDPRCAARALAVGQAIQARHADPLPRIVARCLELLP
jgi:hypothetical protein